MARIILRVFVTSVLFWCCAVSVSAQNAPDETDVTATDTVTQPNEETGIGGGDGEAPFPSLGDIQAQHNSYNLDVLGDGLAGDHIDIDTGALSLTQMDVSIPGNNSLPVTFGRMLSRSGFQGSWLGDWNPAIPYISRHYLEGFGPSTDRCTGDLFPHDMEDNVPGLSYDILSASYFSGFTLNIAARQPNLHWVIRRHWFIGHAIWRRDLRTLGCACTAKLIH